MKCGRESEDFMKPSKRNITNLAKKLKRDKPEVSKYASKGPSYLDDLKRTKEAQRLHGFRFK